MKKKGQYKDLALSFLREEIDIDLSTGKYVKSPNSDSLFVSENVETPTKVSQNNDDLICNSDDSQASTDESYNPKNEDRFSQLEHRLDMLQNFFLKEISSLRREIKDLIRTKVTANKGQISDVNEFLRVDENLNFLRDKCRNKDKIINILS